MTRAQARALRAAMDPAARHAASERIAAHVLSWPPYQAAGTVMAYASIGEEVETDALLAAILAAGKRLLLPKCLGGGKMIASEVKSLAECTQGWYDILEPPDGAQAVPKDAIDLILAPGLLFDPKGNRLGQGGGYYDRFLAGYAGVSCGLAFAAQVVPGLATRAHDMPVDALATEAGIHFVERRLDECQS